MRALAARAFRNGLGFLPKPPANLSNRTAYSLCGLLQPGIEPTACRCFHPVCHNLHTKPSRPARFRAGAVSAHRLRIGTFILKENPGHAPKHFSQTACRSDSLPFAFSRHAPRCETLAATGAGFVTPPGAVSLLPSRLRPVRFAHGRQGDGLPRTHRL